MSNLHPTYKIPVDEFNALKAAVRAVHPKGGMQTASVCVCGSGGGGPAGSPACRGLLRLLEQLKYPSQWAEYTPCPHGYPSTNGKCVAKESGWQGEYCPHYWDDKTK